MLVLFLVSSCASHDRAADSGTDLGDLDAVDAAIEDAADTPADVPGPPLVLWDDFAPAPPVRGSLFQTRPHLGDFLAMGFHQPQGASRPDASHLGDFGVGNGRVFAEEGLTFPLNTLHGMVGPTYSRQDRFYGDLFLFLGDEDGDAGEFDEEWIAMPRLVPAVVSAGRSGDLLLVVADLAPLPAPGTTARPVHAALWRRVVVSNEGNAPSDPASLVVATALKQRVEDDALVETRSNGTRVVFFRGPGALAPDDRRLVLPVPSLPPGDFFETDLIVATAAPGARTADMRGDVAGEALHDLIDETAAAYGAFEATTARVETPDPVVNDFFTVLTRTLFVQVSAQGASSPMSRYTLTWTRDLSGVIRPLALLGAHGLARRILDYYHAAAARAGGLRNAYDADLALDLDHPADVDWASLPPMSGRTAAEGPSHLPLMFAWLWAATGDTPWIASRLQFLRHSLFKQQWNEDYLQPFSGDETFRAAMNIAFGLDIEYPHQTKSWSLVSSVLLAAGAEALAEIEAGTGHQVEAQQALELRLRASETAQTRFRLEDGCLAALIDREAGALSPPFEDAALMGPWAGPPWSGSVAADEAIECLARRLRVAPGVFRSPLDPMYEGFAGLPIREGVYTGMLPGYTLRVLTQVGHPEAEAAFNHLRRALSPSGNLAEYMVSDDDSALQFVYDALGGVGDVTARFRPWEGGIVLDAAFFYLTGFEPDAPGGRARLRPHLPNGWPEAGIAPLVTGGTRFSLRVRREAGSLVAEVVHLSGPDLALVFVFDAPTAEVPAVTLNGVPIGSQDLAVETHFGHAVVTLPDCRLRANETCTAALGGSGS